jgi:hypothetical protein
MTSRWRIQVPIALTVLACTGGGTSAQIATHDERALVDFFEKKVRPLLAGNCFNCHSANTNSRGGLRLDDRNGMLSGGNNGPAIVPGHPEKSLLIRAVHYTDDDLKMPPKKQLSAEEVADLCRWIKDGAAWPKQHVPEAFGKYAPKYEKLRKEHWAWQPLRNAKAPPGAGSEVDRFVRAKLQEAGLNAVHKADKTTLIRRVTFDLTGLPPSPQEIDTFLADDSPDVFEKVVDRLLASPAFGECWGRHWLDVARYAESSGPSRNIPYPHAWRYRDYVIDAFNHDKPYDQFIREQIAGDLLPAGSQGERDEHLVATGFLALGNKDVNQRFKVRFVMDNIDEQIDVVGRGILGLTVSCARCHDHKFEPIPTTDYYALAGIFHSSDLCAAVRNKMGGSGLDYYDPSLLLCLGPTSVPPAAKLEKIEKAKKALSDARAEFESVRGKPEGKAPVADGRPKQAVVREKVNRLERELFALEDPSTNGPVAFGVREGKIVGDTEVRVRGEAEKLGPVVPRGFLTAVAVAGAAPVNRKQSGRLELALWLTNPSNPLTPRVMVNRVWHHLFGRGLVSSVDNFGVTGDRPSHPELLDFLSARFTRDRWSVKRLVRELALSQTYQLGSEASAVNVSADPANRLLWRHCPRRLEAEEIRDATLAASGRLDTARPRGSYAKDMKVIELSDNGPDAQRLAQQALADTHRSVYLPLLRGLTPRSLEVFDFADQGMVTGSRDSTTVAPQALYLLNDPFVRRQSLTLAERVLRRADLDETGRFHLAYRLALNRPAAAREVERARSYVAEYEHEFAGATSPQLTAAPKPSSDNEQDRPTSESNGTTRKSLSISKPKNPADESDGSSKDDTMRPVDPRTAAWASFCQALFGSAEFRYLR